MPGKSHPSCQSFASLPPDPPKLKLIEFNLVGVAIRLVVLEFDNINTGL